MTTDNVRERFKRAVGILADEPGGIKERLMIAYISQLSEIALPPDLPDGLAAEFDSISFDLASDGRRGDEGTVSKELNRLSDDAASHIARRIFNIFLALYDLKESTHDAGVDTR